MTPKPTKADLETDVAELRADNAQLREETDALRDLLAAIAEADLPAYCYPAERDEWLETGKDRIQDVAIRADLPDAASPEIIRGRAEGVRRCLAARVLRYTPGCTNAVPGQAAVIDGQEYPDYCGLELNHEGDCKTRKQAKAADETPAGQGRLPDRAPTTDEACPRFAANGDRCEGWPGHPGSHHADGHWWATGTGLDGGTVTRTPQDGEEIPQQETPEEFGPDWQEHEAHRREDLAVDALTEQAAGMTVAGRETALTIVREYCPDVARRLDRDNRRDASALYFAAGYCPAAVAHALAAQETPGEPGKEDDFREDLLSRHGITDDAAREVTA